MSGATTIPKGNEQPDAPGFSGNLAASYEFSLSESASMQIAVDGRYQGDTYRSVLNEVFSETASYWVINARVSLYLQNEWEVTAWGRNIYDEEYMTEFSNNLALGNGSRIYGAPRSYGLTVTKHFD